MPRSLVSRALITPITAAAALVAACGSTAGTAQPSTSTASQPAVAVASPTPRPKPSAAAGTTFDTTSLGSLFDLRMTVELPVGWIPLQPPTYGPAGTFGAVHGTYTGDTSTWWGPGWTLVEGASVLDPADLNDPQGNAKQSWPSSYIDYMTSLPGVTVVSGPSPVTVGGVQGRQVTMKTPAMHPTIYLKGDTAWLGGGKSGIDPAVVRRVIELTAGGKKLLIEYDDLPSSFDQRVQTVEGIIQSTRFGS